MSSVYTPVALAAIVSLLVQTPVLAEDIKLSGQFTLATDSNSKGVSETKGNGQAGAVLTATRGLGFAALRYKNYKGSDGSDHQSGIALGLKGQTDSGYKWSSQIIYKVNLGAVAGSDNEAYEWQTDLSKSYGKNGLYFESVYSPDSSGSTKEALYIEVGATRELTDRLELSGGIGGRTMRPSRDYMAWNVGLSYALRDKTELDLRYYDTNRHEYSKGHGDRLVLALKQGF
ncbi:hypothetical protein [Asticcacaulis tiandongensis]|uniref:hypothetical protein n=1 Tax=Asticcacaulis tiandongensis TaxID=2565365 RepID=UPI00112E27B5|nr:hypothetical protein [Asticcacaulis tiandongensis]